MGKRKAYEEAIFNILKIFCHLRILAEGEINLDNKNSEMVSNTTL